MRWTLGESHRTGRGKPASIPRRSRVSRTWLDGAPPLEGTEPGVPRHEQGLLARLDEPLDVLVQAVGLDGFHGDVPQDGVR